MFSLNCFKMEQIRKFVFGILLLTIVLSLKAQNTFKRIVSLSPSLTENIYLLGAQDRLVGCTSYCTAAVADGKQVVGSAVNINVEKIVTLKPDLVLTMQLTGLADIETLKRLGIKVEVIHTPRSFVAICNQFVDMGQMVGKTEYAKQLVKEQKLLIQNLQAKYPVNGLKQKVFFQIGANPVFAVLKNTFMDDFIEMAGCVNIIDREKIGTVTREAVVLRNPDVIIIATMGGIGEGEKAKWLELEQMNAARNKKIFLIDSEIACTPTPVNFAKSMEKIFQFVYE